MKYIMLLLLLSVTMPGIGQPLNEWVQIRKSSSNGSEDVWVRKESPLEIAARLPLIHDTIFVDSFRNKIWAAWARIRHYAKPADSVRYDTSFFTRIGMKYSYRHGFISNGHISKKRHSIRSSTSEWISGDYFYVIHSTYEFEKSDTLRKFSSHEVANAFFVRKAHRYLDGGLNKAMKGDRLILTLDEHELKWVNIYCASSEIDSQ